VIISYNRCECNKVFNFLFEVIRLKTGSSEHLSCSLRMTNVGNFLLPGLFCNEINLSWLIIDSHLLPVKIPILFLFFTKSCVCIRVVSTSVVSHPNIKASSRKLESWCKIWRINDPLNRAIFYSMLK